MLTSQAPFLFGSPIGSESQTNGTNGTRKKKQRLLFSILWRPCRNSENVVFCKKRKKRKSNNIQYAYHKLSTFVRMRWLREAGPHSNIELCFSVT